MKLRLTPRSLSNHPNRHRPHTSYTLHSRHLIGLLLCSPHMPRRPIWLTNPKPSRKRSFILLHLHLHSHWPRNLLRLIPKQRDLKCRSYPATNPHGHCFRRLRSPMRTDIILRSYSNYKPTLCYPIHRSNTSRMSLRRLLGRQPHTNPILRSSLPPPLRHCRPNISTSHPTTRIRV